MLEKVKMALRITINTFDDELKLLINAAKDDLKIAGVDISNIENVDECPIIVRAVITYCKMNFGEPADYDRLKHSYDEQKAQLKTATGYTDWGE